MKNCTFSTTIKSFRIMGKTIRAFKNKKGYGADYSPKNEVSSIYQKHGIEESDATNKKYLGHRSRYDETVSRRLRKILKRETENLVDSEIL